MEISELFDLADKLDSGEELPTGWNEQNIITALTENVDALADKKAELDANLIITSERAKQFNDTKKVSKNEIDRFKSRMVYCFQNQDGKKFPGQNFVAGIVRKFSMKPNREPKFSDYTDKTRMKYVIADFEWKKIPNADVFAALQAAGMSGYCGYKFTWDENAIKARAKIEKEKKEKDPKNEDKSELTFCESVDSSYVQFKPKKGK